MFSFFNVIGDVVYQQNFSYRTLLILFLRLLHPKAIPSSTCLRTPKNGHCQPVYIYPSEGASCT